MMLALAVSALDGGETVALQPGAKPPLTRSYRTAYGTHFDVASTWTLLLGVHVVLVVGAFALLSVIPVRFATHEKAEATFELWFGSTKKKRKVKLRVEDEEEQDEPVETESVWRRASSWLITTTSSVFAAAPSRDADVRYRFHADMTQQLAASAATAKTYESIAIATDDLEGQPRRSYESVVVATDDFGMKPSFPPQEAPREVIQPGVIEVETLPLSVARATREVAVDPRPSHSLTRPSSSRSSLFMSAPPSPPSEVRMRQGYASSAKVEATGRLSRVNSRASAVETKEDFVRAASRRQSMAVRIESREALARGDVSYENLKSDEIQVFEYLEFVRELLDGLALKKICQKSGRVVSRTLYITTDMQVVFWNSIGAIKRQTQRSSLRTELIDSVQEGLHGSANATARSTPEREPLCVSIHSSNGKWLVLEAKTKAMRQRLFLSFTRLAQENHQQEAEAAIAPLEPTVPEALETEEELDEREEQQMQLGGVATSSYRQTQVVSTIEAAASLEREDKYEPFTEAEESEIVLQQLDYEEKAPGPPSPPPLEENLLRREILSMKSSFEDQTDGSDGRQDDDDQGGEEQIGGDIRVEYRPALSIEDEEKSLRQQGEQHEEGEQDEKEMVAAEQEEKQHVEADQVKEPYFEAEQGEEQKTEERMEAVDDDDIDNLSDDPELSRE
ncbi:hypothetical protein PHYPSEUDO_013867 [Phytophthora pseudosyringae]|uniref:Uncharacterized protein n=1 Tax=Phytophthora pseudosyringae TaxID=221518 RepID=A0A8T1W1X6_9STRA|nr:hypothetical protein PHYPSEUDO_013867 [Phytophthora pseudosyringae]